METAEATHSQRGKRPIFSVASNIQVDPIAAQIFFVFIVYMGNVCHWLGLCFRHVLQNPFGSHGEDGEVRK